MSEHITSYPYRRNYVRDAYDRKLAITSSLERAELQKWSDPNASPIIGGFSDDDGLTGEVYSHIERPTQDEVIFYHRGEE